MKTIAIDQIKISPDRQRKEFDLAELNKLGQGIKDHGLMQAIVLREQEAQVSSNPDISVRELWLVAGERRLRAISDLWALGETELKYDGQPIPPGHIPYVTLGELDELGREEAEAEENLNRRDLTWQEEAAAVARITALRARQAELRGEPPPSNRDIAAEVFSPKRAGFAAGPTDFGADTVRKQQIVARHLVDPEVKSAKSVDEAFKVLKRKEEIRRRVEHAAFVGKTYGLEDLHAFHQDSLTYMAGYESGVFDCICTDPPYGIDADEFGDSGGKAAGAHFYKDSYENWKEIITTLAHEGFRITKPQAHLYCFCDITRFEEAKAIFGVAGWRVFRTPFIWHKPNGARTPWVNQGPQRRYELILFASKGDKQVTRIAGDVLEYRADENIGHQAQKPVALIEDLLRRSCSAGDFVLDPFAGSGPILPAAFGLKLHCHAVEEDAAAYALCTQRMEKLKEQPELAGL